MDKWGKPLTWILLSAAALGQLLITAGFMRQDTDLITPGGKTIPISYIDIRFSGNTASVLGLAVITLIYLALFLCAVRRAYTTIGAVMVAILLYGTFLAAFFTNAEEKTWLYGVVFALGCMAIGAFFDNVVFARRRKAPADASALTATDASETAGQSRYGR
ncbi:MAG TPA: hypothetical protein VHD84_02535 [Candidatus Saccharimonadales bacterium]|nr:hypothetical protein [Candidatus Saccharimonadales bacterium]